MIDQTAKAARLLRVFDAVIGELDRQGLDRRHGQPWVRSTAMAYAVIKAADGDVVQFPGPGY